MIFSPRALGELSVCLHKARKIIILGAAIGYKWCDLYGRLKNKNKNKTKLGIVKRFEHILHSCLCLLFVFDITTLYCIPVKK